jgi:hypothetical protein
MYFKQIKKTNKQTIKLWKTYKIAVVLIMSLLCVGTILAISDGLLIVNCTCNIYGISTILIIFCSLLVYMPRNQKMKQDHLKL